MFLFFITIFVTSLVNAFVHGWELTLVIFSAMPVRGNILQDYMDEKNRLFEQKLLKFLIFPRRDIQGDSKPDNDYQNNNLFEI